MKLIKVLLGKFEFIYIFFLGHFSERRKCKKGSQASLLFHEKRIKEGINFTLL